MIIVEGMDGTGKSTLIDQLHNHFNLPVHDKASTSMGGPVQNIFDWAHQDVMTWGNQPLSIYDRHPLISELIYGPICRGQLDNRFLTAEGTYLLKRLYEHSLIILCAPPFAVVNDNLHSEPQPQWVWDNAQALYDEYVEMLRTTPLSASLVVYDYTKPNALTTLYHSVATYLQMKGK